MRRTKEVGRDTRERLGLDTNIFAPKVANIGKKYSDPIIEHKGLLDQALIEQQRGNQAASDALMRKYYEESRKLQERARIEDPSKANDVSAVIKGAFAAVVERGLKPTEVQASMLKFDGNRNDPIAVAQHDAMLKKTEETPQGRIAVAAYRADEAKAAQVEAREVATNQATLAARAAGASDLDNLLGKLLRLVAELQRNAPIHKILLNLCKPQVRHRKQSHLHQLWPRPPHQQQKLKKKKQRKLPLRRVAAQLDLYKKRNIIISCFLVRSTKNVLD